MSARTRRRRSLSSASAVDLLDGRLGGEDARIETRFLANHATLQSLTGTNHRPADHVADRAALHRDDRLMTITPVRSCREAGYVSSRDGREHAFDLNGWHVVACVDDHVAIGADDIVKVIAAREGLDHRDVELFRQSASPGAESPYRPRRDLEKFAEPFDPLFDERLAMDEGRGWSARGWLSGFIASTVLPHPGGAHRTPTSCRTQARAADCCDPLNSPRKASSSVSALPRGCLTDVSSLCGELRLRLSTRRRSCQTRRQTKGRGFESRRRSVNG